MGRKLLKTVQTITTFRNPLADPMGTRRGPPLVRGPQFENRCVVAPMAVSLRLRLLLHSPGDATTVLHSVEYSTTDTVVVITTAAATCSLGHGLHTLNSAFRPGL